MDNTKDTVAKRLDIYQTTNYGKDGNTKDFGQFKLLEGNRSVDKSHVRFLVKKMEKEGILLDLFPIEVSKDMYVLDGQHRLLAARRLGVPVYYVITDGNIDTVVARNTGQKNWGWKDFIYSWAERGNQSYIRLQKLIEEYPRINFSTLMLFTGITNTRTSRSHRDRAMVQDRARRQDDFTDGELIISEANYTTAHKLLAQYFDFIAITHFSSRELTQAIYQFIRKPGYRHELMLSKMLDYGAILNGCYTQSDFLVALEEIWNSEPSSK
jgi:hypothetical protein